MKQKTTKVLKTKFKNRINLSGIDLHRCTNRGNHSSVPKYLPPRGAVAAGGGGAVSAAASPTI